MTASLRRSGPLSFAVAALLALLAPLHASDAAADGGALEIVSTPPTLARSAAPFVYTIETRGGVGELRHVLVEASPGADLEANVLQWEPAWGAAGVHVFSVESTADAEAVARQVFNLRVVDDFCLIYPIALPAAVIDNLQPGARVERMERGTGAGNFSWLSWTGAVDAPTLAQSLLPPGDSYLYVNPDDADDRLLEIGDWAQGATGSMNASAVRANLDALMQDDIILPVWDATRGQGSRLDYRVVGFAVVRLLDYRLTGNGWLSVEYKGRAHCYNQPPVAEDFAIETLEDVPVEFNLRAVDSDGNALIHEIIAPPTHGSLSGDAPSLLYTPNRDYNGEDRFTYRVSDGRLDSNVATVTILVHAVNDPPVAHDQSLTTPEDTPLPIELSGSDVDGDQLTFAIVQPPSNGQLHGDPPNLVYLPDADWYGEDAFTFVVSDGEFDSEEAVVQITVTPVNDPPVAHDLAVETSRDSPIAVRLTAEDIDGDDLEFRIVTSVQHGSLSGEPPQLVYTPMPGFVGDDHFSFAANDGEYDSNVATVTISIRPINRPPTITSVPPQSVDERDGYLYRLEAIDPDDDELTFAIARAPIGAHVDEHDGLLQWTADGVPAQGLRGTHRACRRPTEAPAGALLPRLKWHWKQQQVLSVPVVAPLRDTNHDGRFDDQDVPTVVFLSHNGFVDTAAGILRLVDGETGATVASVTDPTLYGRASSHVAVGDIDGDGRPDIVYYDRTGGVIALEADLSLKWRSPYPGGLQGYNYGAITLADLDGDGRSEILASNYVLNHDGTVRFADLVNTRFHPQVTIAADLTLDGFQEVIMGNRAYTHDGTLLWKYAGAWDGAYGHAIGNLDDDPYPEIVMVFSAAIVALKHDGTLLWRRSLSTYNGGAATIADLDGDGVPEVVALRGAVTAFRADGTLMWKAPSSDSSDLTGLTVFDFDGDGAVEVVYADETRLKIHDGRTGALLWSVLNGSATASEYPVVADVNGDGRANILVPSDRSATSGLRMFASADDAWMPTRKIWNQYAYHIDNINDDASIPRTPQKSWLSHNTFRLNTFQDRHPLGLPDLALFDLRLDESSGTAVDVAVVNRGLAPTAAATLVSFYNGDPDNGGVLLGRVEAPALAAGATVTLRLSDIQPDAISSDLFARIDEAGLIDECTTDNNQTAAAYFSVQASDPHGLHDMQRFTVVIENINEAPAILTRTLPRARANAPYRFTIAAHDPDVGDGLRFEVVDPPAGLHIEAVSGEVRWTPQTSQIGSHGFLVRTTDLGGLRDERHFELVVFSNHPPQITSAPVTEATPGVPYVYAVEAIDPDGDALTFRLDRAPEGMSIDGLSGLIEWMPSAAAHGAVEVEVVVDDARGGIDTQTYSIHINALPNHPPIITSSPPLAAFAGQLYRYLVDAEDPDGDAMTIRLIQSPAGMSINVLSGEVRWIPAEEQLGDHAVAIEVDDGRGGIARQAYSLLVSTGAANRPPQITSTPPQQVVAGTPYVYPIEASDPDGDALSFALTESPADMQLDPSGARLTWLPTDADIGVHVVTLVVDDGRGGSASQTYELQVSSAGGANRPPVITSTPSPSVPIGDTYGYAVVAVDADGDTLAYRLVVGPAGMAIDAGSGVLGWTPEPAQLGAHDVTVEVTDGRGGSATQTFMLSVIDDSSGDNRPPTITSTPPRHGKAEHEYRYAATGFDADGDPITWSLSDAPAGMTVDAGSGLVRWIPPASGRYPVSLRLSDAQSWREQAWEVEVVSADTALSGVITINPRPVQPGAPLTITLQVIGAAGPIAVDARLDGEPIALAADSIIRVTAPEQPGVHELVVEIDDGFEQITIQEQFAVVYPDALPPTVRLLAPVEPHGQHVHVLTAPTDVIGSVHDAQLAGWVLALRERGTLELIELARGSSNVDAARLGVVDPTGLENGQYTLILEAWDHAGNISRDWTALVIEGDMKLGHFSIAFEDLSVPVAGLPITVIRSYDTRRRHRALDFGHGWSVDYQSATLHETRTPGFAWTLNVYPTGPLGLVPRWCVEPHLGNVVSVTLPDGQVEKFEARAYPECNDGVAILDVELRFAPLPGTHSTLKALNNAWGRLINGSLADPTDPARPLDPSRYLLVTQDGRELTLDQGFTIREIHEREGGNRITFGHHGIVHSAGPSVTFVRDGAGRITRVIAPDGRELAYEYDAHGDLVAFVDAGGDRTTFTYQSGHYLRDIIDPRGVRVARNEYDDAGRLIAVIDAAGHRVEYDRDIAGRTERVRDRNGGTTTYVYNDRGDVIAETNPAGETTYRSYDAHGNMLSETDPLGRTRQWTYNTIGQRLTETDPTGAVTRYRYGAFNQLETQTDPSGRIVLENHYANTSVGGVPIYPGPLTRIRDANGHATTFGYDSRHGELTRITDASGAASRHEYDARGFRTAEIDALGRRTEYDVDPTGRVLEERRWRTRADGSVEALVTAYTYDDKGRLIGTEHPDGSLTTTVYNSIDKPELECDGLNRCTRTTYDDRGNVARIEYPDGSFETQQYDGNGNLIAQTDRAGRTTRFVFDAANRIVETIHPDETPSDDSDNPRTTNRYDATGQLIETTDENGRTTTYRYDAAGRRTHVIQPHPVTGEAGMGPTTITHYDTAGRRVGVTDPNGRTTRFVLDDVGRVIETVHPDDTPNDDSDNPRSRVEYDAVGRKTADIDEEGRITRYSYDTLGRLTTVVLPNPVTGANPPLVNGQSPDAGTLTTRYEYDEGGNRTAQIDAEGRTTRFEYDAMGRETARVLPEGQRETKRYNEAGELVEHTDFNGRTTTYHYDRVGRLERIEYPTDADVEFGYLASGERERVTDGRGVSTAQHDRRGRIVQTRDADGGVIEYAYDDAGNLLARVSPSQSLVYTYDALNRIDTVTRTIDGEAPLVTRYEYDDAGHRTAMVGADGIRTEYRYDRRSRLRELVKKSAAGVVLLAMNYSVDASGLRTAAVEADQAGTLRTVAWQYDGVRRLTKETIDHRDPWSDRQTEWTYDRGGNRLTQVLTTDSGSETTRYAYDANDRLLSETAPAGVTTYTFDDNGNTLTKSGPEGDVSYRYDDANRLIEARTAAGVTEYVYNADGLRVRQTHTPTGGAPTTTWYLQDSGYAYAQVIEEWTSEGAGPKRLSATYTFADDLVSQTRYAEDGVPTTRFIQADGFSSTRWLTDAAGTITDSIDYDAFGVEIGRNGETDITHMYRGQAFDPNVGFYYLRARWMNPVVGRFTRMDDYRGRDMNPHTLHKYLYAHNDPVNGSDPSGYMTLADVNLGVMLQAGLYATVGAGTVQVLAHFGMRKANQVAASRAAAVSCAARYRGTALSGPASCPGNTAIPMVFMSATQMPAISLHVEASQMMGRPSLLRRTWILKDANRKVAKKKCALGVDLILNAGSSCDEYPFASSYEGGFSSTVAGVPLVENLVQGGILSTFYAFCGVTPDVPFYNEFVVIPVVAAPRAFQCRG